MMCTWSLAKWRSRYTKLIRKRSRPVSRASLAVEQALSVIIPEALARYKIEAKVPAQSELV